MFSIKKMAPTMAFLLPPFRLSHDMRETFFTDIHREGWKYDCEIFINNKHTMHYTVIDNYRLQGILCLLQ